MYTAISILIVIVSILLTIIVLVQNSKGGGLAANFASGNQAFGVRQTADFLEKATWTLAITVIVLCVLATAFVTSGGTSKSDTVQQRIENSAPAQGQPEFPSNTAPSTPAPATEKPSEQPATPQK